MERPTHSRSQLATALGALVIAVHLSGCQIIIGTLLTLQGRPMTTCEFTTMTHGEKLTGGKKVLVLSCSATPAQLTEPSLDQDVISEVSRCLKNDKVDVVDPFKVNTWIDDRGGISDNTDLAPIGREFKADYIILFKFDEFGYAETNSPGLYQGHASYRVVVVKMVPPKDDSDKKLAKIIYNRAFSFKYPENRQKPAEDVGNPDMFKSQYKAQLAQKLTRLFIDYRPEDDMF